MKSTCRSALWLLVLSVGLFLPGLPQAKADKGPPVTKLHVEVVGGDKGLPVAEASVYVRYTIERRFHKDKKVEMNLKTNHEGVASVPDLPRGEVLIQVIAPGWKTFGQNYRLDQDEQTVHIKLEKAKQWY